MVCEDHRRTTSDQGEIHRLSDQIRQRAGTATVIGISSIHFLAGNEVDHS